MLPLTSAAPKPPSVARASSRRPSSLRASPPEPLSRALLIVIVTAVAAGCTGSPEPPAGEPAGAPASSGDVTVTDEAAREETAADEPADADGPPTWQLVDVGSTVGHRGLSVVDEQVVWISGAEGRFFSTVDGGATWRTGQVPGMDDVDFRDVEGIDDSTAYLLSAGDTARIYRTTDGGRSWLRQYARDDSGAFFDGMAFRDPMHAIAFSDPVNGAFLVLRTDDGGSSWSELPDERLPAPVEGEAGFAASGTNVAVFGDRIWIGTGGATSRVLHSPDWGETWMPQSVPMATGDGAGVFSVAFWDELNGVAVGGDFRAPDEATANAAWTDDGGATWRPAAEPPRGYRSGVAVVPDTDGPTLMAVGPTGSDLSLDGGRTWQPFSDEGFHAVAFAGPELGWAAGADGRVAVLRGAPGPAR